MNPHHLPDDTRRWPRDPYEILGVTPRCEPLVARKAYTRLIKQFKPEQYPEQFRLIREAYDAVKRQAVYFGAAHAKESAQAADLPSAPSQPAAAPAGASSLPASGNQGRDTAETLRAFWDEACRGQQVEVYNRFREMYERGALLSELPARLYALLLACPELDSRRVPCDWLVRGMNAEGPWGRCRQLYRREIADHPAEALSERFTSLLDERTPPGNLLELLSWRWEALSQLGQTQQIPADLSRVGPSLKHANEDIWIRTLLKAVDYLAWNGDRRFADLCEEIDGHVHLHHRLGEDLSRLDFLRELSRSWRDAMTDMSVEVPLLSVLPLAWTNAFENRHRILQQCRAVAEHPAGGLEKLDAVEARAPLVLAHLGQTLGWLWHTLADPRDDAALTSVVEAHCGDLEPPSGELGYRFYRKSVLALCVTECIAPEMVANLLWPQRDSFVWQRIHDDWPLRIVCAAHRLIWN